MRGNGTQFTAIPATSYGWVAGQWVNIRITWDSTVATGVQNVHFYINGVESAYELTATGPFPMPAPSTSAYIYVGSISATETLTATGILDEFKIYGQPLVPSGPGGGPTSTPTATPSPTPTNTAAPAATSTPTLTA